MKKIILLTTLFLVFGCSQKFTKNNACEFLEEQNLTLQDDFSILENHSDSGIGDYYHTFTLSISEKDKNRIVEEIKNLKILSQKMKASQNSDISQNLIIPK